jgi:hypothetical protein
VVSDFTSTLSIYGVPGGARRVLAGELARPGSERLTLITASTGSLGTGVRVLPTLVAASRQGFWAAPSDFRPVDKTFTNRPDNHYRGQHVLLFVGTRGHNGDDELKQSAAGGTRSGNCRVGGNDPGPSNTGSPLGYAEKTLHRSARIPSQRKRGGNPSNAEFGLQACGTGKKGTQEVELPSHKSIYR